MKKRMGLTLLHFILKPVDDGDKIFFNEDPIYTQLLPSIDDAYSNGSELDFWDRQLKEKGVHGRQQPFSQILDDIHILTLGTTDAVIKVHLHKFWKRGSKEMKRTF